MRTALSKRAQLERLSQFIPGIKAGNQILDCFGDIDLFCALRDKLCCFCYCLALLCQRVVYIELIFGNNILKNSMSFIALIAGIRFRKQRYNLSVTGLRQLLEFLRKCLTDF